MEKPVSRTRTKEGLERARAEGKTLGRPKGALGKSKLDGKQKEIQTYLHKKVNLTNIARIFDVSRPTLVNFIKTRGLSENRVLKVALYLEVENNSKFVRGKKRARENIENYVLSEYDMKKSDKDSWEYELTIPYKKEKDLDDIIYNMLSEVESHADMKNCFTEADVTALDNSGRSW